MAFQRILIAVDGSEPSLRAIDTATKLAIKLSAQLALVHVIETYDPQGSLPPADLLTVRQAGVDLLDAATSHVSRLTPSEQILREGAPADEVIAAADHWNADLIVTGTHGRSGVGHALLGSTAESIVRHAHCAVLTIRG